ncbi:class I SAM-dependent methyltransferase [Rossellomorea aquimaris]|uniref:class I SAM-dependent methyltransferase n=1 Tax=Rossellomorea aquimaris TaxID=189382 RepID=UPI001CD301DC|nr:class I SAM-dependent methyltransferase [Rossellomorea aquimaris]MCA1054378.1 class I SAM-dependent methyltransferase [Rossellomorea aquimaris]
MEFRGSSVYDQEGFFENYFKRRDRVDSPNNAIEGPVMWELIDGFEGKSILDLGCGDGSFGKDLLEKGAGHYTGVEGSVQMAEAAERHLDGGNAEVIRETMESFPYPEERFDIVTSRFAIHYVADLLQLFKNVHRTMKNGGKFVFSVQHPLTTSSFDSKQSGDKRGNWIVDDYFIEGERKEPWIDRVVVKQHRTIEHYFEALTQSGFTVTALREGTPRREHFTSEEEFLRRQRIPVVLVFGCVKK